ncbi:MAG TPA: DoxX family protein [Gaiellaceae bacterium]
MDWVFLAGRILFAIMFFNSGLVGHILGRKGTAAYARQSGVPLAESSVVASGAMIIVGSVLVALGAWGDLGALLIAAFLVVITPVMHAFWRENEPMTRQLQQINFLKNVSLLGAALILFYVWNQLQGSAGLSLTDPLFARR